MKLFVYKTFECKDINVKFLSRDLPLQLWFNENISNYYIQKECVGLIVNQKG